MSTEIKDLEPGYLFGHFASLLRIPRESKNEAAAREFVLAWAGEKGFKTGTDDVGNVVVYVPATPGNESAPITVLQSHLDMVCEKAPDSDHDFEADPIPAYVDGDLVRSKGTTLGADNGIGLAAAMAAAEDPDCEHGPLELFFTIDEETGLTGAFEYDPSLLKGRLLLNLDSEDEGTLYVGCAGGGDTTITLATPSTDVPSGWTPVLVKVGGLKGGHSGLDIGTGRGNAIKLLARALHAGAASGDFMIGCIGGGSKRNAIPRDSSACVFVPSDQTGRFTENVAAFTDIARLELGNADPGLTIETSNDPCECKPMTGQASRALLRLLLVIPHGATAMSQDIPGLVETSTNLAVVKREDDETSVLCNTRSSVDSALEALRLAIASAGELAGGKVKLDGKYPGWRPNLDSPLLARCTAAWKEMSGNEPQVAAIHAGLECGVISEKAPGMDAISFGPTIRGAHSPDESVSIGSTGRFYDFLKLVLKGIAHG
ncbi:MAG: aminoacyl-histidine dipeptidase [Deltaproteobacteria bacterium]|nr:aminoacyl-histidine dipeptidase [Deltaproteobacteria bacterium]